MSRLDRCPPLGLYGSMSDRSDRNHAIAVARAAVGMVLLAALAPAGGRELPDIIVTAPGGDQDDDDATRLDAADLTRAGRADVLGALARSVPGVSLADAQGNPWQPNLVYRGFVASPLQGNAQGLAVYLDGGRFNQPFGDTVNFDLLPATAIDSITLKDASPVYGLNALGGAIIIATKTGRSAPGVAVSLAGGAYGRVDGSVEAGWRRGEFSAYATAQANNDDGWRRFSPSRLYTGFADLGWDGAAAGLHLKLLAADNDLTGNGAAPVELLAADRRAVFTHPDNTRNRFLRTSLHPWAKITEATRIEASLYWQKLEQRTLNGDAADIEGCEDDALGGLLCLEAGDEQQLLIGTDGAAIADTLGGEGYGLNNRSRTDSEATGALVQFVDERPLFGGTNSLVIGFSHDRSHTRFAASSELGELTPDRSVTGLGPVIAQPDGIIAPIGLVARTRYWGLFLSDRLPLLPGLTAEIGLRWNEAEVQLDDQIGTALDGRHRFRRLNPGIELDYAVVPGLSLRAGYAETNRAPTPAELSCADEAAPCSLTNFFVGDPPLQQVVARSFEAGAQGRSDGAWQVEWLVSAWRTTSSDDIQFVASSVAGRAYFRNIGRTRRQGIELGATARHQGWTLRAGYALTDARFLDPLRLNSPNNPAAEADGSILVRPGDRIPGVPRHRGVIAIDYAGKIAGRQFTLGGDLQAQSGQRLYGDEAGLQPSTAGFAIVNLRGSIAVVGPLTLFGEVTNLLDARPQTFGTFSPTDEIPLAEAPGASDPRSLGPGAPRRWLAGLKARF